MAERKGPGYGTPNWELIGRWLELPQADDGPFWALNLMRYREVADYGDGATAGRSGREADDEYAPLGPLEAIGAMVAFHGDVVNQPLGSPVWDRVGIVRYPSRAAFFAMQRRDDFKQQHVHKEAGMAATIVMACIPTSPTSLDATGTLVLTVEPAPARPAASIAECGVTLVAALDVEGVIVGDDRTWASARFERAAHPAAVDAIVAVAEADAFVLVLDPEIDRLAESIQTVAIEGSRP
jgi:hypothetical protein